MLIGGVRWGSLLLDKPGCLGTDWPATNPRKRKTSVNSLGQRLLSPPTPIDVSAIQRRGKVGQAMAWKRRNCPCLSRMELVKFVSLTPPPLLPALLVGVACQVRSTTYLLILFPLPVPQQLRDAEEIGHNMMKCTEYAVQNRSVCVCVCV